MNKAHQLERFDDIQEMLGTEQLLNAVLLSMSADELKETADFICRCHEIDEEK